MRDLWDKSKVKYRSSKQYFRESERERCWLECFLTFWQIASVKIQFSLFISFLSGKIINSKYNILRDWRLLLLWIIHLNVLNLLSQYFSGFFDCFLIVGVQNKERFFMWNQLKEIRWSYQQKQINLTSDLIRQHIWFTDHSYLLSDLIP